jgi:hypothetical protein
VTDDECPCCDYAGNGRTAEPWANDAGSYHRYNCPKCKAGVKISSRYLPDGRCVVVNEVIPGEG